jgi:hypothetical protein
LGLNGIFKATVELFLLLMQKHSLLSSKKLGKNIKMRLTPHPVGKQNNEAKSDSGRNRAAHWLANTGVRFERLTRGEPSFYQKGRF